MKILTTATKRIISFGEFVKATGTNVVIMTDEVTVATLKELAEANNIALTAKKKADIVEQLKSHMAIHNTEEDKMSNEDILVKIVVDGFAAEKVDGVIKKEMFDTGQFDDFDVLMKTFAKIVKDQALRLTPKDRNAKAAEFLEGYVPEDVETHLAKVSELQDFLKSSTTQAGASMRKWAKDNEITLPVAPKAPKATPGFSGKAKVVADWAISNQGCTKEELLAYAKENVAPTKTGEDAYQGAAATVWNAIVFAKSWANPTGEAEVEAEADMEEAA